MPVFQISTVIVTLLCGTLQMDEALTLTALRPRFSKRLVDICASLICRRQGALGAFVAATAVPELSSEKIVSNRINVRVVISEDDNDAKSA
jgi:hypothetical protein